MYRIRAHTVKRAVGIAHTGRRVLPLDVSHTGGSMGASSQYAEYISQAGLTTEFDSLPLLLTTMADDVAAIEAELTGGSDGLTYSLFTRGLPTSNKTRILTVGANGGILAPEGPCRFDRLTASEYGVVDTGGGGAGVNTVTLQDASKLAIGMRIIVADIAAGTASSVRTITLIATNDVTFDGAGVNVNDFDVLMRVGTAEIGDPYGSVWQPQAGCTSWIGDAGGGSQRLYCKGGVAFLAGLIATANPATMHTVRAVVDIAGDTPTTGQRMQVGVKVGTGMHMIGVGYTGTIWDRYVSYGSVSAPTEQPYGRDVGAAPYGDTDAVISALVSDRQNGTQTDTWIYAMHNNWTVGIQFKTHAPSDVWPASGLAIRAVNGGAGNSQIGLKTYAFDTTDEV